MHVVTPGMDGSPGSDASTIFYLRLRTAVDQFLLPILTPMAGNRIKGNDLAEILLSVAPGAINDFMTRLNAQDARGAFRGLFYAVLVDSEVRLRMFNALGQKLGYGMGEEFARRIAEKLSVRLVPFVGQAKAAMDTLDTVHLVGGLAGLLLDLSLTPPAFYFHVEFGFTVETVEPPVFMLMPQEQTWTIQGKGFAPVPAGWFAAEKRPKVYLHAVTRIDENVEEGWHELTVKAINATGTQMLVEASAALSEIVTPGQTHAVKVVHDGREIVWESLAGCHIAMLSRTPDHGSAQTPIFIRGRGFKNGQVSMKWYTHTAGEDSAEHVFGYFPRGGSNTVILNDSEMIVYPPLNVESCWMQTRTFLNSNYYYSDASYPFYVDRWTIQLATGAYGRGEASQDVVLGEVRLNEHFIHVLKGIEEHGFYNSGWNFLGYYERILSYHALDAGIHSCSIRSTYSPHYKLTVNTSSTYGQPYAEQDLPLLINQAELGQTGAGTFTVGDNPAYLHPER